MSKSVSPTIFGFDNFRVKLYSGTFVDKLGRRTCYSAGKKVPCSPEGQGDGEDRDTVHTGLGRQYHESKVTGSNRIRSKDTKQRIEEIESTGVVVGYAIVFNDQGFILVKEGEDEYGGFLWTFSIENEENPKEIATDTIEISTGLESEPFAEIGNPEEGEGYILLKTYGIPEDDSTWLDFNDVLEKIMESPNPEWHKRGKEVLEEALNKWKKVNGKKSLIRHIKATGPTFTGTFKDSRGRRRCFRDGKNAPCKEFGGKGEGWHEQRSTEDLYDAAKRLVDKIKSGSKSGGTELVALLLAAEPGDLQKMKKDHQLRAGSSREDLARLVKIKLAEMGYQIEGEENAAGEQPETNQPAAV